MLIDFDEMRTRLKSLGLPVYRDLAPKDTPLPYYVYSYVNEKVIRASNLAQKYIQEYEISLFTSGTEKELNPFKSAFKDVSYETIASQAEDENDKIINHFYTYMEVMANE
ncbi:MAG: hypothetical protein ABF695_12315 [Liquorilactobacillus ghanensis]|uniref:hypothetical protein n=1 Tax=Liquorilactobacillus ghanensis TaxID=399370 RepID=UPI0039EB3BEF